jgi:hypothetical protein
VGDGHQLEIFLTEPYPQLLYWFTMPFTAPVPWEAVEYWDGEAGRAFFKDHPVGAGPFFVTRFDRQSRVVLDESNFWAAARWGAPSRSARSGPDAAPAAWSRHVGALPFSTASFGSRRRASPPSTSSSRALRPSEIVEADRWFEEPSRRR